MYNIETIFKNSIFKFVFIEINFYFVVGESSHNSHNFQSSINKTPIHKAIQSKSLNNGLLGNTYMSSKSQNHLHTIITEIQTIIVFRFELLSFLNLLIFLKILFHNLFNAFMHFNLLYKYSHFIIFQK